MAESIAFQTVEKRNCFGETKLDLVKKEYTFYTVWTVLLDDIEMLESFSKADADFYYFQKIQQLTK